ncbi:hypothetical protein [Thermococcus sp.]|uniref:hypothetical protein n=1 Tax=Thermococcus sp. TaxID=35749 RepID=UPI002608129A|nr:hypothetical protein [Thermococcus sp.]
MRRGGQITFDFMIAFMLISVTVAGAVSLANGELSTANTIDKTARLKAFAVDLRDTVTKVYSIGGGFTVVKDCPIELGKGDSISITLNSSSNSVTVEAVLSGRRYLVVQRLQVPVYTTTSVTLDEKRSSFNVTAVYNAAEGRTYVELE